MSPPDADTSRKYAPSNMAAATRFTRYPVFKGPSPFPSPLTGKSRVPLLELLPHPERDAPPRAPRPELAPPPSGFSRSFHASPAAYPRALRESHGGLVRSSKPFRMAEPGPGETAEERKLRNTSETRASVQQRYAAHEWTADEARAAKPPGMWLSAERWKRDTPRGGCTLIMAHANGLIKEPLLHDILTRDAAEPGALFGLGTPLHHKTSVVIDEVWMFDDANHSIDLNTGRIGPVQVWSDVGRDFLNFVQHVLPNIRAEEAAGSGGAPYALQWSDRAPPAGKVIGVGHSFGGNGIVQAAHARPDLFEALFLVDPMCPPHVHPLDDAMRAGIARGAFGPGYRLSELTLKRRDTWDSRAAALKANRASPFMKPWADDMFNLFMTHGIVPVDDASPNGAVTLKTPPWSEAAVFTEPWGIAMGFDKLAALNIPVGFLMAHDPVATQGEDLAQEMVWRAPLSRNERSLTAGHLVLQEEPKETADSMWRFLTTLRADEWGGSRGEIQEQYRRFDKASNAPQAKL